MDEIKDICNWDEGYIGKHILSPLSRVNIAMITVHNWHADEIHETTEIAKCLSAAANSGGYVLITSKRDIYWNEAGIAEWLRDGMRTYIKPRLEEDQYEIRTITQSPRPSSKFGKGIVIINIPASPIAPHQSNMDYIYYGLKGKAIYRLPHHTVAELFRLSDSNY